MFRDSEGAGAPLAGRSVAFGATECRQRAMIVGRAMAGGKNNNVTDGGAIASCSYECYSR